MDRFGLETWGWKGGGGGAGNVPQKLMFKKNKHRKEWKTTFGWHGDVNMSIACEVRLESWDKSKKIYGGGGGGGERRNLFFLLPL